MKNIYKVENLDKEQIFNFLNHGSYGRCYHYGNGFVLKQMKLTGEDALSEYDRDMITKNLKDLVGIKNNTFVFPTSLYLENNYISSYLMPYISGICLDDYPENINVKELLESLGYVYEDIINISNMGILSSDLLPRNMILDNDKKIKIIDVDFYSKFAHFNKDKILASNLSNFNYGILGYLMEYLPDRELMPKHVAEFLSSLLNKCCNGKDLKQIISTTDMVYFFYVIIDYIYTKLGTNNLTVYKVNDYMKSRYRKI